MHKTLDEHLLHIYVIGVSTGATVSLCLMIDAQEMWYLDSYNISAKNKAQPVRLQKQLTV